VIYKLRDLLGVEAMGGTMRLGAYPCRLKEGTLARSIYGVPEIQERHRHRYEVNQKYLQRLQEAGLVVSGLSPDGKFVEMVELPGHPWFLGCQFHPEYQSKPTEPHPLFVSYIGAALEEKRRRQRAAGEGAGARPQPTALVATLAAVASAAAAVTVPDGGTGFPAHPTPAAGGALPASTDVAPPPAAAAPSVAPATAAGPRAGELRDLAPGSAVPTTGEGEMPGQRLDAAGEAVGQGELPAEREEPAPARVGAEGEA
jgi:hypothetical protein